MYDVVVRQINIESVVPGMVTARHVYPQGEVGGIPLLAAKVRITEALLKRLHKSGVNIILIDDELSQGIDATPVITDDTRRAAITAMRSAFSRMSAPESALAPEQIEQVEGTINQILTEISSRKNLLVCLSDLNVFGGDRMQHAVNVCVVGCAVARTYFGAHGWTDYRGQRREDGIPERLTKLGIGLLLQDIGMLSVPDSIRNKHGILTAEERRIVQQHPLLGLELLEGSDLSPLTKVAVAQHHERHDGSGYPRALAGDDIHIHGQIAAIAETYVSLGLEDTGDGEAFEPHEAWRLISNASGRMFRPDVVAAFIEAVAPYGPGATVQLTDGRYGIVVGNRSESPLEPVVRVTHDADGLAFVPPIDVDLHAGNGATAIKKGVAGLPGDRNRITTR